MSQDQKFQRRWEFRRGDDELDSSSDDSKSSSGGEPGLKKHALVSDLILPENDEAGDTPLSQPANQFDADGGMTPFEFGKTDKMHPGPSNKKQSVKNKMMRGSKKKNNRKKNNCSMHKPVSLDGLKIFMESIIEELKVARENMFAQMREELKKMVAVELASRPTRKKGSRVKKVGRGKCQKKVELGVKTQNCDNGSVERSVKSERITDSPNCYEVLEKQVNSNETIGNVTSNGKDEVEKLRLSVKKPKYSSNLSDQVVSSPSFTLPTVLSEPRAPNRRMDSYCNYIQPGAARDRTGMNSESTKSLIDANTHQGYFSGIEQAERIGSFSQMGSQNMGYFDQGNALTAQTSTLGTGFNIPSQALDNANILGLRMDGGAIRFSGESHALSEHFVANDLHSRMKYKTEGGLLAFGNRDLKEGHLYPN